MFGTINNRPWLLVKVEQRDPAVADPCIAPATPASDYIISTYTLLPKIFFFF